MASVIRGSDNFDTTFMTVGSLATNGYTKMPNGLIIQWGTVTGSSAGGSNQTITFPIAFPNACLNVQLLLQYATSGFDTRYWLLVNKTTTSFTTTYTVDKLWFAIGY